MNGHRVSALLAIPPMRNVTPASQDRSPGTPTMRMNGAPKMVLWVGHPPKVLDFRRGHTLHDERESHHHVVVICMPHPHKDLLKDC
jgi:hypothetical protein